MEEAAEQPYAEEEELAACVSVVEATVVYDGILEEEERLPSVAAGEEAR
jgi:hypothetical protein